MDSRYHLLSLPSELRDEIYFYTITLIFEHRRRYTYHGGIERHILTTTIYGNYQVQDPTEPERSNELADILTVSHLVNAEVQSVLSRRFSFYLTPDYIRCWSLYETDDVFRPRNWSLVRNLVWQCFVIDSAHTERVFNVYHLVSRSELEQLAENLPGLRQVDILLRYPGPLRLCKAAVSLADMFTKVLDMTVYIEEGLEDLEEKLERMNMDRTHSFYVKIISQLSYQTFPLSERKLLGFYDPLETHLYRRHGRCCQPYQIRRLQ